MLLRNMVKAGLPVLALATASPGDAHSQVPRTSGPRMARIELSDGVSVSIPNNWVVEDAQSNRRRFAQGKMVMDLAHVPSGQGGVLLTASPHGNPDRISVVISLMRRASANQADVANLRDTQLVQVNHQFRQDLEAGMRIEHATLVEWRGAGKARLGGLYSLVSHYIYQMPGGSKELMESHRVFLGWGSVGFMMQAPIDEADRLRPTFTAIKDSFRASRVP